MNVERMYVSMTSRLVSCGSAVEVAASTGASGCAAWTTLSLLVDVDIVSAPYSSSLS